MRRSAKTCEIRSVPIHSPWRVGKFSDLETDSGFETIGIVLTHWLFHCARIGMLSVGAKTSDMVGHESSAYTAKAFLRGLRELGYVFGEHFGTEPRGSEGKVEQFGVLASELVREQVDVIVAAGPVLAALQRATTTIPVVMAGAEDPCGLGGHQEPRGTRH